MEWSKVRHVARRVVEGYAFLFFVLFLVLVFVAPLGSDREVFGGLVLFGVIGAVAWWALTPDR